MRYSGFSSGIVGGIVKNLCIDCTGSWKTYLICYYSN